MKLVEHVCVSGSSGYWSFRTLVSSRLTMSSDGNDLPGGGVAKGMLAVMDCLHKISLPRRYDTEGDTRFGELHRCAFSSVEVGTRRDHLVGKVSPLGGPRQDAGRSPSRRSLHFVESTTK